jgi:tetratricopeptide (TPR) repeat protein
MQSHLRQLKQQGLQAFERKDYATALEYFQAFLEERPGFADIRHSAGLCLGLLGRTEEALEQLDLAIEVNPGYVEAHVNRALLLQELGRYDEAREAFALARRHERQGHGRFPSAVTARLAHAHAEVGDLYMDAGAPDEAVAQYELALQLRPEFHDIRNRHATALLELGRTMQAVEQLRMVLEENPHYIDARLNLGLARFRQGRLNEAGIEWEACRVQQPSHPQVSAYLSMLERVEQERTGG